MSKAFSVTLQIVFFIGFLVLLSLIIYGAAAYDISAQGQVMLDIFWGKFTFVDIYVSFIVFFLWVVFREKSVFTSIVWFVFIMLGGSMAICLYMFHAFRGSGTSYAKLLAGKRAEDIKL